MAVKILHTADWQIGKRFADLDELDGDKAAELRQQRLKTVAKIATTAKERAVDAVVVAGDVFDSNDRSKVDDDLLQSTLVAMEGYDGSGCSCRAITMPRVRRAPGSDCDSSGRPVISSCSPTLSRS